MKIYKYESLTDLNEIPGYASANFPDKNVEKMRFIGYILGFEKSQYIHGPNGKPDLATDARAEYDDFVNQIRALVSTPQYEFLGEEYVAGDHGPEYYMNVLEKSDSASSPPSWIYTVISIDTEPEEDEEQMV